MPCQASRSSWTRSPSPPAPFTTSQTQTGDYDGFPATFKTAFAGNFHGLNSSGLARAAGDLTETMSYTAGGTNYSCTSNQLAFAAAYDATRR